MTQGNQRYVSEELSHFVGRRVGTEEQFGLLVKIVKSGWLTHPPHRTNISGNLQINASAKFSSNEMYNPQIVCFCDIPVGGLHVHTSKYGPFGLAFSKSFIVDQGGCPVFYVPTGAMYRNGMSAFASEFQDETFSDAFDRLIPEIHEKSMGLLPIRMFLDSRVFSYVKFFDASLSDDDPNNFYMEREWRVVGNVQFQIGDVRRLIIPQRFASRLREAIPEFVGQLSFSD